MLVGRERELGLLDDLLADARRGRSRVLALVGEPGVGKSALLDACADRASDMLLLRARGIQSEAHVPFAALLELTRPVLDTLQRIPPPQAAALEGALALRPPRAEDRFAIGAATLSLLAAAADNAPVLVLVDDMQWVDGSTADALLFACRRLVADPIAVVLSVRDGEPTVVDQSDIDTVVVSGLDRDAAGSLVAKHASIAVPDRLVERLHRQTGGNPLALLELSANIEQLLDEPIDVPMPVSHSLAAVYATAAGGLPARTRTALLIAAASETGDLSVLARANAALGVELADLAPAENCGLIRAGIDQVEFRHPLARSAVYGSAHPEDRRAAHRALADSLPDAEFDRRAWHLALAAIGPDDAACSALEQAGQRATERSAYDVASRAYERAAHLALDESRRADLLLAAANTAWLGGLARRAMTLINAADRSAASLQTAVALEHLRGEVVSRLGLVDEGRRVLLGGAELAFASDPDQAVAMFAEAANAAFYEADPTAMEHAATRAAEAVVRTSDPRSAFFTTIVQGMALVFSGASRGDEGAQLLRTAIDEAERVVETTDDPRFVTWAAMGPLWLREAGVGRALVDRAIAVARQRTAVGVMPYLLTHVAIDQAASNQWSYAEATLSEAIGLARETDQRTDLAALLSRLAWLEARQGREEACREHADEALRLADDLGVGLCRLWALAALADLELGLGNPALAKVYLEKRAAVLDARGIGDADLSPAAELAEVTLRLGDVDAAVGWSRTADADATRKGQPWALARAARARGLVSSAHGFDEPFLSALQHHAQTPDLFEMARTRLAYGACLRRARRRVDAREQLRQAIDDFERLGATPWSDQARTELEATGEKARARNPSTINQLTPQELQIALLLAGGNTTREAAAALFVSPKTIEYHLRSVYRKLAVSSRAELANAIAHAQA
jgi:DNA-binding CsgD family transcriptional regulator